MFNYKNNKDWGREFNPGHAVGADHGGLHRFLLFLWGFYLDKWLGFRGVFTTIFIFLGIAGGANVCYRQILEVTDPKKKEDPDDHHTDHT